jgi:Flp pilus assembly protein TadG
MSGSPAHAHGATPPAAAAVSDRADHPRGQALAEFALVLLPILLILVGIIQFGLLFGANVSLTNAAREGARAATIYVYDQDQSRAWNDAQRCGALVAAATDAFGLLSAGAPYFNVTTTSGACPTTAGDTLVNGDLTVSYCDHTLTAGGPCPVSGNSATTCVPDTRHGCLVQVSLMYHSDIVVPLVGSFLGLDGSGRFVQRAVATMVIN